MGTSRWRAGRRIRSLERPDRLFAAARAADRLAELDATCQATALTSARAHAISSPLTLFVNAEPHTTGFGPLPRLGREVRGILELTERTLTSHLADLLPAVQSAREQGWGIALDDVGADTRSLALMPLLRPDVIKLDLRLVQTQPTPEIAAIAGAVGAQAERTGATVLAEGIETEDQVEYARALGATLGQGFLFGRPAAQPAPLPPADIPLPIYSAALPYTWRTPFELASARRPVRRGTIELLAAISRELERQAATNSRTSLLISSFPRRRSLDVADERRLPRAGRRTRLRRRSRRRHTARAQPRTQGRQHARGRPGERHLERHRHQRALRVDARRQGAPARPRAGSSEQEFDFIFTYGRDVIVECAQALMLRVASLATTTGQSVNTHPVASGLVSRPR